MILLWIIALVLAIPTFGISLIVVLLIEILSSKNQSKINLKTSNNGAQEVYRLCKLNGMDIDDIHLVERDPQAMQMVKKLVNEHGISEDDSNFSRYVAECVQVVFCIKSTSMVVHPIIRWGLEHDLRQFSKYKKHFVAGNPLSMPVDYIFEVFNFRTVSAEIESFLTIDLESEEEFNSEETKTLTYIPDELFFLPNLEKLYFGSVSDFEFFQVDLNYIPESIKEAKNLKFLHLQYCGLKELPPHIFTPWLKELKIGGNQITVIPDSIENAESLEKLTAWGNKIRYISEKIGTLKHLKRLNLEANPEDLQLPKSIVNLGDMEELYIYYEGLNLTEEQLNWIKKNHSP